MDITITITQEMHDCMLAQLRKKEDGSDDLTVQEWAQGALDGKANKCLKNMNPAKVAEREVAAAEAKAATDISAAQALQAAAEADKAALVARVAELEAEAAAEAEK